MNYYLITILMYINITLLVYMVMDLLKNRTNLKASLKILLFVMIISLGYDAVFVIKVMNASYIEKFSGNLPYLIGIYTHYIPLIIMQWLIITKIIK